MGSGQEPEMEQKAGGQKMDQRASGALAREQRQNKKETDREGRAAALIDSQFGFREKTSHSGGDYNRPPQPPRKHDQRPVEWFCNPSGVGGGSAAALVPVGPAGGHFA